ncbi:MAG: hypothetical protein ACRDL7_05885 [Gaiellaceae bacterium]
MPAETKTYDHYPHLLANRTSEAYKQMAKIMNSSHPVAYGNLISCSIAEEEEDCAGTFCEAAIWIGFSSSYFNHSNYAA